MDNFFILLVFSFIAIAMSDQDTQHSQQESEYSSTKIETGPFQYQQYSSNFNTAKKDSSSTYQTYTVKPKPLIEFANSQQRISDKPKSFSFQDDDMMWVYPDNPIFKQMPKDEHRDISKTSITQSPDSNPKPSSEQINNLQSIVNEKPAIKTKPLIDLINDMQSIVTKQQDEKIKPLIDLFDSSKQISSKPFGTTNISDIEVLNASQAIDSENSASKPKQLSGSLSTSQSIPSQPVILADRFTQSSNTPQPIDNEPPVVNSTPLSEFLSKQQPSFSNPFDLLDNPNVENDKTPQLIDTVHSIVKKVQPTESEKSALEPVNIPQIIIDNKPISTPETPINQLLEVPPPSVPQYLPLRGLLDDLNSLGLLEKPTTIIEFDEPLVLSSPSSWPSGINAVVQQAQNQIPSFGLVYPDPDLELSRRISSLKRPIFQEPYLPVRNDFGLVPVPVPGINPPFNPWDLLVPTVGYQNNGFSQYPVYPTSNIDQFGQYGLSGQGQFNYANGFQDNPFRLSVQPLQFGNYLNRKLTHQQLQELFDSLLLNNYGKPSNTRPIIY